MIRNPHLRGDPFLWQAGPVGVLLVHGYTATTAEVRPLAERLHALGYTVSGPLLPGHYSSPADLNRTKWQDWAVEAESAYQRISTLCDQIVVGGESVGGLLALHLAIQHPEITGLLLYAPALRLNNYRTVRLELKLIAPFVPWFPKTKVDDGLPWQGYDVYPLKGAVQVLRLQQVILQDLPKIRQPVLIVQGKLDQSVHPETPQLIYAGVRSEIKEIFWMNRSTHCVILDSELDQVAEITADFLDRILRADRS